MGAWDEVGTDRYCDMETWALLYIYESNQKKQDFLALYLLFVICSKNYGKQIALYLS